MYLYLNPKHVEVIEYWFIFSNVLVYYAYISKLFFYAYIL
jgi:hypothetical protein